MYNYLTIGSDCSPAAALRRLNLREFALPFDWVVSSLNCLAKCFEANFDDFHKALRFNNDKTRLIDYYGFQFPHDYPLSDMKEVDSIGEGVFGEEKGKSICSNWMDYYEIVFEKYKRRIDRFTSIINDTKPIIVLCRYNTSDVLMLQYLFAKNYKKENIFFINSSIEDFESGKIKNIYTERNNIWNDINIWEQGMTLMKNKIESLKCS